MSLSKLLEHDFLEFVFIALFEALPPFPVERNVLPVLHLSHVIAVATAESIPVQRLTRAPVMLLCQNGKLQALWCCRGM